MQEAVNVVETWSYSWGFKFSVEKKTKLYYCYIHYIIPLFKYIQMYPKTRDPSLNVFVKRTSDDLSVYTVEMMAIVTALQWIEDLEMKKVILCSDSSSALMPLHLHLIVGRIY